MATIREIYYPMVEAAQRDDPVGHSLLAKAADDLCQRSDEIRDGMQALAIVRQNLDYYCQYFDADTAAKTKAFYNLGAGLLTLTGVKMP